MHSLHRKPLCKGKTSFCIRRINFERTLILIQSSLTVVTAHIFLRGFYMVGRPFGAAGIFNRNDAVYNKFERGAHNFIFRIDFKPL